MRSVGLPAPQPALKKSASGRNMRLGSLASGRGWVARQVGSLVHSLALEMGPLPHPEQVLEKVTAA